MPFNLRANIRLNPIAPKNTRANIEKRLNIKKPFDLNIRIDPRANARIGALSKRLQTLRKNADGATSGIGKIGGGSLAGILSATAAIAAMQRVLKEGIKTNIEWKDYLVDISIVAGNSTANLQGLAQTTSLVARNLGVADQALLSTSLTLKQAGFELGEIQKLLPAIAQASLSPTFNDLNGIIETLIVNNEAFKLSIDDNIKSLGAIDQLSSQYAVSSDDLGIAVSKAGGTFALLGADLNELLAIFTTVRSTTRQSSESISNALNTIAVRLQRESTQNFLKDMGFSLRDANDQLLPLNKQFQVLGEAFNSLGEKDPLRSQLVEVAAGIRQYSKLAPILSNLERTQEAYNVALDSGNRLAEVSSKAQAKTSVQYQKVINNLHELSRQVGESFGNDAIDGFLSRTNRTLEAAVELNKEFDVIGNTLKTLWDITPISLFITQMEKLADVSQSYFEKDIGTASIIAGRKTDIFAKSNNSLTGVSGKGSRPVDIRNRQVFGEGAKPENFDPNKKGQAAFNVSQDVIPTGKSGATGILASIQQRINESKSFQLLGDSLGPLEKLPGIIERINESGLENVELDQFIQSELKDFPDAIRNSVDSVKDLTKLGTLTTKLVSVMEKDLDKLETNIAKRNALAAKGTSLQLGLSNTVAQRDGTNNFRNRLRIVTGQSGATAKGLGNQLQTSNSKIKSIESQLDGATFQQKANLLKQLNVEQNKRNKLIAGLELFANTTDRLNKVEQAKLDQKKNQQANIDSFVGETSELKGRDKRDKLRAIADAQKLAETGNLSSVKETRQKVALDVINRFSGQSLNEFGGKTGRDVLTQLDENEARKGKSSGLTIPALQTLPTRKSIFADSVNAQQALIKGNKQQQDQLTAPQINFDGLTQAASIMNTSTDSMSKAMTTFATTANEMAKSIPSSIDIKGDINVNHSFNGHEVFAKIQPAFAALIDRRIEESLNQFLTDKFPKRGGGFLLKPTAKEQTKE